jgi:4-hydroxyacetophenone monooxygenase
MGSAVDSAFIRRAVEASDLEALRAALYQASGDPELATFAPVATLDPSDRARLVEKAIHLLETDLDRYVPRVPSDEEIRRIMDVVLGGPTRDEHFEVRRKMLAFEKFPFLFDRPGGPIGVPEGFEVAIIGAGLAGIAMAVQLDRLGIPYVVYERRDEIGGTWSRTRYPDIRVDTLSLTYEFSFDEQYPWSEYFARGAEVRGYIDFIARKYGVFEKVRFGRDLESAHFDDGRSTWHLTFVDKDGEREERDVNAIVSAAGLFANARLPEIPGIEDFKGTVIHPTEWPRDLDLSGKRVAVVGNGSTGVQLLAPVAREAQSVHVFQRTPQWIAPRPHYGEKIEPEVRWLLDALPGYWNWCRYTSMIGLFTWHEDFLVPDLEWEKQGGHITRKSEELRDFLISYIREQVGDRPDLIDRLIPDYAPMVRRPVVDNSWYKALTRDNVELVTDGIARLTPGGIETADGEQRDFDAIVFATGYDVDTYLWPAEYRGRNGVDLQEFWAAESPRAYLGMMMPDFPNLFVLYGPNSQPVSGGISLPSWFQIWAAYVGQCLTMLIDEGHSAVAVTDLAYKDFNQRLDDEAAGMAFVTDTASVERNYYVNASGRLQLNTPFETADLYAMQKAPNRDDLEFT